MGACRVRMAACRLAVAAVWVSAAAQSATLVRYPYLQNARADRITIVWTTNEDGAGEVQFSTDQSYSSSAPADSRRFGTVETGLAAAYFQHQAQLSGLRADTQYFYRVVVDGQVLSAGDTFRTAGSRPFNFLALGDSGQGSPEQGQIAQLMIRETPAPALVLHTGDLAYPNGTYDEFERFYFNYYRDLMKRTPFFPTPGNHEYFTRNAAPYLAVHAPPTEGIPLVDQGRYYSFDWGNVHFVSLDTNTPFAAALAGSGRMLTWLENDLRNARAFWRVVYFHHPAYANVRHENDPIVLQVKAQLAPILERHNVPLVLNGHEHNYQQTFPMRDGQRAEPGIGTVYITTGGGGGPIRDYPVIPRPWLAFGDTVFHYVRAEVQGSRMTLRAIRNDGFLFDTVNLAPLPVLSPDGTVNAASFTASVAPGGLISIFGRQLAAEEAQATNVPLPTSLAGVSVTLNGRRLPLLYVSGSQVNAQLPFDVVGPAMLRVTGVNGNSAEVPLTIADMAPAIFAAAVLRADGTPVSASSPVEPGEFLSVYVTGLGRVEGEIAAGQAAPASPLLRTRAPVEALLSGAPLPTSFAGLAPGFVGLYQVNLQLPAVLGDGTHPLRITTRGINSNAVNIAVRTRVPEPPPEPPGP